MISRRNLSQGHRFVDAGASFLQLKLWFLQIHPNHFLELDVEKMEKSQIFYEDHF